MSYPKSFTRISALLCLTVAFFSCNEDTFLDRVPADRFTPASFYQTEQQINEATITLYPIMRGLAVGALNDYGDYRSDNTTFQYDQRDRGRNGFERVDYFLLEAGDGFHNGFYNPCYTGIARANYILDRVDEVEFATQERRASATAEARFFRGYYHFLLVQHFGDIVPSTAVVEGDGTGLAQLRRQPFMDVYNQVIIPDLQFAIDNLPITWDDNNTGRVTRAVAEMALAKAYFHLRDYSSALPFLNAIVDRGNYRLLDNFADVFRIEQTSTAENGTTLNPEILWAAQFNAAQGQGAGYMFDWIPNSGDDITMGQERNSAGFNIPTCDLIDAYEDNDRRRAATFAFYDADPDDPDNDSIPYSVKFLTIPYVGAGIDVDYPIFRYADVLLMQAEALVETGQDVFNRPLLSINNIRRRAGLPPFIQNNPRNPEFSVSTPEEVRDIIRRERRLELAYEGHRSYDLRRYGIFEERMRAHGEEQRMKQPFLEEFPEAYMNIRELLAIPQGQIDLYGYRQNPGWE